MNKKIVQVIRNHNDEQNFNEVAQITFSGPGILGWFEKRAPGLEVGSCYQTTMKNFVKRIERLSLSTILKKFLKFPKSEPRDFYKLDSYK